MEWTESINSRFQYSSLSWQKLLEGNGTVNNGDKLKLVNPTVTDGDIDTMHPGISPQEYTNLTAFQMYSKGLNKNSTQFTKH